MAPFDRSHTSSYSPFIVTMAISLAISEIFSIKEWPDLEMWVWGCSRSLKMAWFDRPCMTDRIALSESHASTLTRDKNCWMHYSSEQNVSRTSVSPARLRLVKYRRFWLLSRRREVGAEIRELPEKYRRSGNPTNKYVPLKKAASSREPKPMWMTHKAYKAVKKKYRVFARYKDKRTKAIQLVLQQRHKPKGWSRPPEEISRGNLLLRLEKIKKILLCLSKIKDKI